MRFLKRRIYTCDEALKKSNRRLSTLYARITFQKNKLAIGGLHRSKVNSSVRKIYILRSKRDQLRKMQLQGLLASVAHSVERWSIDIQGRAFNSQPVFATGPGWVLKFISFSHSNLACSKNIYISVDNECKCQTLSLIADRVVLYSWLF